MKFSIFLILFLILITPVLAATIHGDIYDFSLDKVSGAIVTVNTTPEQFQISDDGTYSFDIPNGFYELKAEVTENSRVVASEVKNVTVKQTGSYVIDFILFPNLGLDPALEEDVDFQFPLEEERKLNWPLISVILIVVGSLVYFITIRKKKTKNDSEGDLEEVLRVISEEGGRTTQKDIRKKIPLSEAKISLMITELEHKGKIEKIKKGRGNIIVLKR